MVFFTLWPLSGCNPGVLDIPVKIKIRNQCYSQSSVITPDFTNFILRLNNADVSINELSSKRVYWSLVHKIRVNPTARTKYESLFSDYSFDWERIYSLPHIVTLDTRSRIFQFKLLNRIVYTNAVLYKMKLSDTTLCSFCESSEETLEHTFLHCQFSSIFWTQVINWLNSVNFNIEILSDYDKMFGYIKERPHRTLLNHIIIIAKQVIYYNRRRKTKPLLCHLITKLKFIEHVEYFIAKRKSRLVFHQRKWQILKEALV